MNRESEHELAVVILEEKAKVVLGHDYATLPYDEWVEELKSFVQTQRCPDCGAAFDLDDPAEEIWAWFLAEDEAGMEELEVAEFFCSRSLGKSEEEREIDHPVSWGALTFRRGPTGTFPLEDNEDDVEPT